MKIEIYYKVCRKVEDSYLSLAYQSLCCPINYKLNEWNYPEIGKIFVFASLEDARNFSNLYLNTTLFKCAALNCVPLTRAVCLNYTESPINIVDFWNNEYSNIATGFVPLGTLGAEAIYLLEQFN